MAQPRGGDNVLAVALSARNLGQSWKKIWTTGYTFHGRNGIMKDRRQKAELNTDTRQALSRCGIRLMAGFREELWRP